MRSDSGGGLRVVSLISSGTEILFALGLGEQVLAVSHECDYPPAVDGLPRATRSCIDSRLASSQIDEQVKHVLQAGQPLYEIDAELLCRLAPELIVTQAQCDVCAVRLADVQELVRSRPELRRTRVLALNPESLDDVLSDVFRIGQTCGAHERAEQFVGQRRARIGAVTRVTSELPDNTRPGVVCIEWVAPLMAAGNWTPELIELAGGMPGLATAGEHSGYVQWADIQALDPDVLFVAPCGFDLARSRLEAEQLRSLPGFASLAAVASGRAYVLDGNAYLNRSGPRLVESLELLAALLHPGRFPPPMGELAEGRAWSRM
ncbi:MAG: ABC transporter substrate-binding protein [Planctomycetaceae bacterium]|nr:ABC transporter substrate-binding protein [Planctomycetaceae bacterium]